MSRLSLIRIKMYRTVARQLHGVVPCWVCGEHVDFDAATLEHIRAVSDGGSGQQDNLAISHAACNAARHAASPPLAQSQASVDASSSSVRKPPL